MPKQLFANNATSKLSGILTQGGTVMICSGGDGNKFPTPTDGDYFLATLYTKDAYANEQKVEVVKVTSRSGDSMVIERDVELLTGEVGGNAYNGSTEEVFLELRWTALGASSTLQIDDNLASLTDPETARSNLGLGNVDNTADMDKPVSTIQASADAAVLAAAALDATAKANAAASASAPVGHVGSTGAAHGNATTSTAGFMSSADKSKLDGISAGANNYSLPTATPSVLGGVKVGANLSIDGSGVLSATGSSLDFVLYDDRATLRSADNPASVWRVIEGLGLFKWYLGSTEIDDDETCFATASGCWLIEAMSQEVAHAIDLAFAPKDNSIQTLSSTGISTVSSVVSEGQVTVVVPFYGVEPGDAVNVYADTVLSFYLVTYARVLNSGEVTVYITNLGASSASIPNPTTWTVFCSK
jgi:hypothetical protein